MLSLSLILSQYSRPHKRFFKELFFKIKMKSFKLNNFGSEQRLNSPLILPIGGVCSVTPPRGVLSANPPIPSCNQTLHEYTWAPDGYGTSEGLDSWSGFSLAVFSAPSAQQIPEKGLQFVPFLPKGRSWLGPPASEGHFWRCSCSLSLFALLK